MRRLLVAALPAVLTAGFLLTGPSAGAEPDVAPAAEPASTYTPRSPVRVLDTRNGSGPVRAGGTVTIDLASRVPVSATAVVLNVTGVGPTAGTYITVFPSGTPRPTASSLNLPGGDTRANQVTVALGADRRVSLYNNAGDIHLVADLAGHYGTGAGARFTALPPNRVLDTRTDGTTLGPGGTRVLDLSGAVPESATAVTFNLTAARPTAGTYVTAWPTGTPRPAASNLNLPAGDIRPNLVTAAVGPGQQVSLFNLAGSTNLIADLSGFYTPAYGAGFQPLPPQRVLDTRNGTGTGGTTTPVGPDGHLHLSLDDLPTSSTGVLLNLTGITASTGTVVTAWAPVGNVPNASTLNVAPNAAVANAAAVAFTLSPAVAMHNSTGSVHLVADLAGVFVVVDHAPCTTDCVHGWGENSSRELGNGSILSSTSIPAPVVALSGVRAVTGNSGTGYALREDGTVWAWGSNLFGELGNGWRGGLSYAGSAVPVPVVGLTGVTAIEARGGTAYALREDGTVWAWGENSRGQLGTGNRTDSSVPVRVTGLTDVTAIGAGDANGYAVRADGSLWAWGSNGGGHLGNGSTVEDSPTPVQVQGLTGVTEVAGGGHSNGTYARLADGTIWAWGYNFGGALGSGRFCEPGEDCLSRVPVRVSGLTGMTAVASGVDNGLALRDDGTVWTWGVNHQGQLGNGVDCTPGSDCVSAVPVQVVNLSQVTRIVGFFGGGYALRADGTVWSWGINSRGTLGNDTVSDYTTVPVRVQGITGASDLGTGGSSGYAVLPNAGI